MLRYRTPASHWAVTRTKFNPVGVTLIIHPRTTINCYQSVALFASHPALPPPNLPLLVHSNPLTESTRSLNQCTWVDPVLPSTRKSSISFLLLSLLFSLVFSISAIFYWHIILLSFWLCNPRNCFRWKMRERNGGDFLSVSPFLKLRFVLCCFDFACNDFMGGKVNLWAQMIDAV